MADEDAVIHDDRSVAVYDRFLFDPHISDRALRLLAVIKTYGRRKGVAFPGRERLAEHLGCSTDTIDRCIKQLAAAGAVTVEQVARQGGGRPINHYWLWPSQPLEQSRMGAGLQSRTGAEIKAATKAAPLRPEQKPLEPKTLEAEPSAPDGAVQPRTRTPNPAWDAIVSAVGWDPARITRAEAGRVAKALKDITGALPADTTLEDVGKHITARAGRYAAEWPTAELTPTALAANWSRFAPDRDRRVPSPANGQRPGGDLVTAAFPGRSGVQLLPNGKRMGPNGEES